MNIDNVNLLTDPWLSVENRQGVIDKLSLPRLFSAMERDDAAAFPAVRPHQAGPWHVFLVQLAAHCLEMSGESENLPSPDRERQWSLLGSHSPEEWRAMLRALTPDFLNDEPWQLVVEDLSKPAFMQPPVPEKSLSGFKRTERTPDDLDLLISSKNFDVKTGVIKRYSAEDWLLALISLQTNGGVMGRGNYGCSRQNGGYGIRSIMTLQSSSTPSGQWARDCRVILDNLDDVYGEIYSEEGKRLLWLESWDGDSSLQLPKLHPLFIEICRRLRARKTPCGFEICKAPTNGARVDASAFKGAVLDPWITVVNDGKESKAFGGSLSYENLAAIFSEDGISMPLLLKFHAAVDCVETAKARCIALMKGQGKTEGYVERIIPIKTSHGIVQFGSPSLRQAARNMVELAKNAEYKVLKVALARFLSCRKNSSSDTIDWNASDLKNWLPSTISRMDAEVNDTFFERLWSTCENLDEGRVPNDALRNWRETLIDLVKKYFETGAASLPCCAAQRIKSQAVGELCLLSLIKKHLSVAGESRKEEA